MQRLMSSLETVIAEDRQKESIAQVITRPIASPDRFKKSNHGFIKGPMPFHRENLIDFVFGLFCLSPEFKMIGLYRLEESN